MTVMMTATTSTLNEATISVTKSKIEDINVVVIGGGPGGMFFIHHVLNHMKQCNNNIKITCYERTSRPGGIWRSPIQRNNDCNSNDNNMNNTNGTKTSTSSMLHSETDMYDQLWTNGPCQGDEFYDYTFNEHFNNQPITVYLKRQDLLDYMIGRVTKNHPDFFNEYFQFNTEVIHIKYNNYIKKFIVQIKNMISGMTSTNMFDKCIWACGPHGKPNIPNNIMNIFCNNNFKGKIIHSSQTEMLQYDVRNKRILVIGGEYSAEDITLQSIKLGVNKVYICSRITDPDVASNTIWPYNKVELLLGKEVKGITENGTCIQFHDLTWHFHGYKPIHEPSIVSYELYDIDTVIFCTGYKSSLHMLDDDLNQGLPGSEPYIVSKYTFDAPTSNEWQMKPNPLTSYTGNHVELSPKLKYLTDLIHPNFYHGVLISNPNIMFISNYGHVYPLLSIEVHAWYFAQIVCDIQTLPSTTEMNQYNTKQSYEMLHYPYLRLSMDENYSNIIQNLSNFWPEEDGGSCCYDNPIEYSECENDSWRYQFILLAQLMYKVHYPTKLLCNNDSTELNDNGEALFQYNMRSGEHRSNLHIEEELLNHNCNDDEATLNQLLFNKTYRDYNDGHFFKSIHTGTSCISLNGNWLDTDK